MKIKKMCRASITGLYHDVKTANFLKLLLFVKSVDTDRQTDWHKHKHI